MRAGEHELDHGAEAEDPICKMLRPTYLPQNVPLSLLAAGFTRSPPQPAGRDDVPRQTALDWPPAHIEHIISKTLQQALNLSRALFPHLKDQVRPMRQHALPSLQDLNFCPLHIDLD